MKNIKFLFLAVIAGAFILASCSKDKDPAPGTGGLVKVQYKIIGSSDVKISTIAYYDGDNVVTKTGSFGSEWTSEGTISSKTPLISANALGTSDASTLKAQILVDGKVVKESPNSTGKVLQTSASYY